MGEVIGTILFAIFSIGGMVWLERSVAKIEAKEDEELREAIKHLPLDKQVEMWAIHLRCRAERDRF